MKVRRVVTGHDADGSGVVVSDDHVAPFAPDLGQKWSIWAGDVTTTLPNDGTPPPFTGPLLPQPGGFHITVFTLPPRFNPDDLLGRDPVRAADLMRRAADESHPFVHDPNPPGAHGDLPGSSAMHATASMDCLMQVSGESVFVLDDTEVCLRPGDWLILNGVAHSCRNDGDETAVLIGVVIGAHHKGVPLRTTTA
ncbi:hypothetical protein [Nonomuraea helvata]|uniref:Cupin domain-containing protein n=1 Tax=Nonomuraea helvata TaxID=37484 RepID=A0ABV5S9N6_9ACTN